MRKGFSTILIIFCIAASANAQTASPSVLASAGGSNKTSSISLDWTMGEYAVETIFSGGMMYTQGFNQPYLIVTSPEAVTTNNVYTISIAPNPVLSILNFSISSRNNSGVFISVTDIQGKMLMQRNAGPAFGTVQFDFKGLPAGSYTLTAREAVSGHIIKTYQIIRL